MLNRIIISSVFYINETRYNKNCVFSSKLIFKCSYIREKFNFSMEKYNKIIASVNCIIVMLTQKKIKFSNCKICHFDVFSISSNQSRVNFFHLSGEYSRLFPQTSWKLGTFIIPSTLPFLLPIFGRMSLPLFESFKKPHKQTHKIHHLYRKNWFFHKVHFTVNVRFIISLVLFAFIITQ